MNKLEKAKSILGTKELRENLPIEYIVDLLPRQAHNGEAFGLMFMQVGGENCKAYSCSYYSHFSKKTNPAIPKIRGYSMRNAAVRMLRWFVKHHPAYIK